MSARRRPASGSTTTAATASPRRLRSVAFVAEYLACDHTTVRRWIEHGELRAYRLGSGPKATLRIDLNDVDAFVRPVEVSA